MSELSLHTATLGGRSRRITIARAGARKVAHTREGTSWRTVETLEERGGEREFVRAGVPVRFGATGHRPSVGRPRRGRRPAACRPSGPATVTPPVGRPAPGANGRPAAGAMPRPPAGYPDATRQAAPGTGSTPVAGPRKVRLTVARVDPWSVLKLSFLLSVALGIVHRDGVGACSGRCSKRWASSRRSTTSCAASGSANTKFDINQWVGLSRVVSLTTVVAVVNVLIIMALSTLGAVLYNLASSLVGGLHGDFVGRLTSGRTARGVGPLPVVVRCHSGLGSSPPPPVTSPGRSRRPRPSRAYSSDG